MENMDGLSLLNFYKGRKVFMTGHTGFKGTWLANILIYAGADLTGYALDAPEGKPSLFKITQTDKKMRSITGDVRDLGSLSKAVSTARPEIVFHLAAQPIVKISYQNPAETYETNVMGTVNILESVRKTQSVRSFVNVTTDKVYKNKEWVWGYRETEELCGSDPYSNSKSCSELVTYSYKQSFFPSENGVMISTARSGNVIGGGDFSPERIVPDCIRSAKSGRPLVLRNPYSIRPYQHVLECLYGYLLLAAKQFENQKFEGAYNFGPASSDCITTAQLADIFCKFWGGKLTWRTASEAAAFKEASVLKLDNAKARKILGWQPHWNIETAVKKTIEWERGATLEEQIKEYFKA